MLATQSLSHFLLLVKVTKYRAENMKYKVGPKSAAFLKQKQKKNQHENHLGFDRTFDERPESRHRDDKEAQRSVITGQRVTRTLCQQDQVIGVLLDGA